MSVQHCDLISELDQKLGNDATFYTLGDLVACGIFGSVPAARYAMRQGRIQFIRVSPRRLIISRAALLQFLLDNVAQQRCKNNQQECVGYQGELCNLK